MRSVLLGRFCTRVARGRQFASKGSQRVSVTDKPKADSQAIDAIPSSAIHLLDAPKVLQLPIFAKWKYRSWQRDAQRLYNVHFSVPEFLTDVAYPTIENVSRYLAIGNYEKLTEFCTPDCTMKTTEGLLRNLINEKTDPKWVQWLHVCKEDFGRRSGVADVQFSHRPPAMSVFVLVYGIHGFFDDARRMGLFSSYINFKHNFAQLYPRIFYANYRFQRQLSANCWTVTELNHFLPPAAKLKWK